MVNSPGRHATLTEHPDWRMYVDRVPAGPLAAVVLFSGERHDLEGVAGLIADTSERLADAGLTLVLLPEGFKLRRSWWSRFRKKETNHVQ